MITYAHRYEDGRLSAHVYSDGTVIFSILEEAEFVAAAADLDPVAYTHRKRSTNRELLGNSHRGHRYIQELRNIFLEIRSDRIDSLRLLYYPEFGDYGYVFSVYFLSLTDFEVGAADVLKPLIQELLEPSDLEMLPPVTAAALDMVGQSFVDESIQPKLLFPKYSATISPICQVYCSWASVVVVGDCQEPIVNLVAQLERGIQHGWHLANLMERILNNHSLELGSNSNWKHIERLHEISLFMSLCVERFRGVPRGMSKRSDLELYNVLRETSRLDEMHAKVERLRSLVREQYESIVERRRRTRDAVIGVAIYMLTILIAWDAYRRLRLDTTISPIEIILVLLAMAGGAFLYAVRERA